MLKRNLVLLLLAFLAFLQGLMPLLHAHAGGADRDAPHFHIAAGWDRDPGLHLDLPLLREHCDAIVDAGDGLWRNDQLVVFDDVSAAPIGVAATPVLATSIAFASPVAARVSFAESAPPPTRAPPHA